MPPTTGGSTKGSSINDRTIRWPGNDVRASTNAIGTPSTMHNTVDALDVRRLSSSAAREDSEVIKAMNRDHSTLDAIAARGRTTNTAPSAAGTNTHRGSPE